MTESWSLFFYTINYRHSWEVKMTCVLLETQRFLGPNTGWWRAASSCSISSFRSFTSPLWINKELLHFSFEMENTKQRRREAAGSSDRTTPCVFPHRDHTGFRPHVDERTDVFFWARFPARLAQVAPRRRSLWRNIVTERATGERSSHQPRRCSITYRFMYDRMHLSICAVTAGSFIVSTMTFW